MKLLKVVGFVAVVVTPLTMSPVAYAATSPGLGAADEFVLLSSTYNNTVSGTTLNGTLGYTTPPAVTPTVNGATHNADSVYNQAGIDQGNALINLNNQPCTYTFPSGAIDLASDTTHGPVGVYVPGVYCITGAADIGGGGTITLNGAGTYIFRMNGALNTSAGSIVTLLNGASVCNVWWTPTAATTLGANSSFSGTVIDAAGITIGSNVTWAGQALDFGGTVSTSTDTISAATCAASRGNTPTTPISSPKLPNTGSVETVTSQTQYGFIIAGILTVFNAAYFIRKKHKVSIRDVR